LAYFIGNTLSLTGLLIIAGLASAISFRAGLFNLGIEGGVYAGGIAGGAFLLKFALSGGGGPFSVLLLCASFVAAMLCGAFLGLICGALKRFCGANELITTFLLSLALNPALDYIVSEVLRDKNGSLLASPPLPKGFLLPKLLPPSDLSLALIIALFLPVIAYIIINKTALGFRFNLAGRSEQFARYGGIEAANYWIPALCISGALSALAGIFAVTGVYGAVHQGFSGGLGWGGIAVALIARNRSLAIIPAALFYALLKSITENILLLYGMSFDITQLIEAIVLGLATVQFFKGRSNKAQIPQSPQNPQAPQPPQR